MGTFSVSGAGFSANGAAVPAGLLGERGDRQPRRQLHDSRTGRARAPSSSTMLVRGMPGAGAVLAQLVPGTRGSDCRKQHTVADRLSGKHPEQVEVGGLLV